MLRQGYSRVFKRYSQAKLNMMREALARLDRQANEHYQTFRHSKPQLTDFFAQFSHRWGEFTVYGTRLRSSMKEFAGGDDGARTRDLIRDSSDGRVWCTMWPTAPET